MEDGPKQWKDLCSLVNHNREMYSLFSRLARHFGHTLNPRQILEMTLDRLDSSVDPTVDAGGGKILGWHGLATLETRFFTDCAMFFHNNSLFVLGISGSGELQMVRLGVRRNPIWDLYIQDVRHTEEILHLSQDVCRREEVEEVELCRIKGACPHAPAMFARQPLHFVGGGTPWSWDFPAVTAPPR